MAAPAGSSVLCVIYERAPRVYCGAAPTSVRGGPIISLGARSELLPKTAALRPSPHPLSRSAPPCPAPPRAAYIRTAITPLT